jgi:hypothetical protein
MSSVTIRFASLLILLGLLFLYLTHVGHALIPAVFGVILLVLGLLARGDDAKRRMLVMHIAVTIALVGFIVPAATAIKLWWTAHNGGNLRVMAFREQVLMAVICGVYVLLCVRSFIAARKARLAA